MSDPLLPVDDFTNMYDGELDDQQTAAVTLLLGVASSWILLKNPTVDIPSAQWVLFELARDEVLYGNFSRLSEFSSTTSRRNESGAFDPSMSAVDDLLTDRQKTLLGISAAADPQGQFGDGVFERNAPNYIDNGQPAQYFYPPPGYFYTFPPGY